MKKYCIFTLVVLFNLNWAMAQLNFNMENLMANSGETISVPVKVTVHQEMAILGLQFSINWDENILDFEQIHSFGLMNMSLDDVGLPTQTGQNNKLNIAWEIYPNAMTINEEITLFYIDFTIKPTVEIGTITDVVFCESCTAESYDSQLSAIVTNLQDGQSEKNGQIEIGGVLPISLVSFAATVTEKEEVLLQWITNNETNNSHFEIERSDNSRNWVMIGKEIAKKNISSQQIYTFLDSSPLSGKSYYRLKQVDDNGAFEYSTVQQVYIQRKGLIHYQNPVTNNINLTYYSDVEKELNMTLYDTNGRLIKDLSLGIIDGNNNISLDVSMLTSGVYFLKILDKDIYSLKIVKY